MEGDFDSLLAASLSPVQAVREGATAGLETAAASFFGDYIDRLAAIAADRAAAPAAREASVRVAAAVAIKNALSSKDAAVLAAAEERWMALAAALRATVKGHLLAALAADQSRVGSAAAAIAAIARVEIPRGSWEELIATLLANTQQQTLKGDLPARSSLAALRRASIEAIGFICEATEPAFLARNSSQILSAVVNGFSASEPSGPVRIAAGHALLNSLDFVHENFAVEAERNIIMKVICEATQAPIADADGEQVVLVAFECLSRVFALYYGPQMAFYMANGVAQLALASLAAPSSDVVLQAIEFWSTICEIEGDLKAASDGEASGGEEDHGGSLCFAVAAVEHLLPPLLALLPQTCSSAHGGDDDAPEGGEWNVSMAAATCLSLLAECVADDIFKGNVLMGFVEANICNASRWQAREAAIMAFGSVLRGPTLYAVQPYIIQGLPLIIDMIDAASEPSSAVRDSAAWSVGRMIDFFYDIIPTASYGGIIERLVGGLSDAPRVAINCAWSLMSLYMHLGTLDACKASPPADNHLEDEDEDQRARSKILAGAFERIASALFMAATQTSNGGADAGTMSTLRGAAYQSLANVILYTPIECAAMVANVQQVMVQRLGEALTSMDEHHHHSAAQRSNGATLLPQGAEEGGRMTAEVQSHLCAILQSTIKKLSAPPIELADRLMAAVLAILHRAGDDQRHQQGDGSSGQVAEDAYLLVGTLIAEMGAAFVRFADAFVPYLGRSVASHEDYNLCKVAVGVVADLARALEEAIAPYAPSLMGLLLDALQDAALAREVKPAVISAIGDISLAMGPAFGRAPFLAATIGAIAQGAHASIHEAASLAPPPASSPGAGASGATPHGDDFVDYDAVDFVCDLQDALLEAYTGIIQALRDDRQLVADFGSHVQTVFALILSAASNVHATPAMVRTTIGLVGDLASIYPRDVAASLLPNAPVIDLIEANCVASEAVPEATRSVARWCKGILCQLH